MEPYIEKQQFPAYIRYCLFALDLFIAYKTIQAYNTPQFNQLFFVTFLPVTLILLAFIKATLTTHINGSGIEISFSPFLVKKRFIGWRQIEKFHIKEHKPIKEFRGWGIRRNFKAKAYTVKGNTCLELNLKNGKTIVLGTQQPEELLKKAKAFSTKNA